MKKLLFIILIGFLYYGCYAQKKLQEGTLTIKGNTFTVKKSSVQRWENKSREFLYVRSSKNKYTNGTPQPKDPYAMPVLKADMNISDEKIKSIIHQVLLVRKPLLKENEEVLSVLFLFQQNGKISDISYSLDGRTNISAEEIEQIDSRLRNEIRADFTGPDYSNFQVVPYNLFIRFY